MRFHSGYGRGVPAEPVVPLVCLAVLIVVFSLPTFMIAPTAQSEPVHIQVRVPGAVHPEDALVIGTDGSLAYGASHGESVFAEIARRNARLPLEILASGGMQANELARLLQRLGESGVGAVVIARKELQ